MINVEKRNVLILAGTQALFQTVSVVVITISGIVGWMLATDKSLATLPIAMMMGAVALPCLLKFTGPVSAPRCRPCMIF